MSAPDPNYEGRNLILCFDGTGNYFDDDNTNIVRLFAQLDKTRTDRQLCYYQPGIGTYVSPTVAWSKVLTKFSKAIDYAVAWYLDSHIMSGYRFLMENYTKGDKIIIFGFSRGAYTARCLAGMLHSVGLLPKSNEEQITFAYAKYTGTNTPEGRISAQGFKQAFSISVDIEYMGVWDTVASVGLTGRHLPFTYSNTIIKTFRQSFSLDERRVKFQPNPWHNPVDTPEQAKNDPEGGTAIHHDTRMQKVFESVESRFKKKKSDAKHLFDENGDDVYNGGKITDVKEIWFPGCHTDVGGGSELDTVVNSLANPSLVWMVNQMIDANLGIIFREGAFTDLPAVLAVLSPEVFPGPRHASEATAVSISSGISKGGREATEGGDTVVSVQEEHMTLDSKATPHDPLAKWYSIWWLLELLPIRHRYQNANGKWEKKWTLHLGRGRKIQQANPVFHISAKIREQVDPKYKPKASWDGTVTYVS